MIKKYSFSNIELFESCPFKWMMRYLYECDTIPSDDPQNAFFLGTAMHKGVETNLEEAIQGYLSNYPVIDNRHIEEIIKLEHWIPKLKELLPEGKHEVRVENSLFRGFIDLLVPVGDNQYDLYDFKYSNNVDHYMESRQLHVYKHYLEYTKGLQIRKLYFVFVPKVGIRQKGTETIFEFRRRLQTELESRSIEVKEVPFNQDKVNDFHNSCMHFGLQIANMNIPFPKNESKLCDWCEYKNYCQKGEDYMLLPKAERKVIGATVRRRLWLYGGAFSGKTTFCDSAPMPLNLNTDGNVKFVTMQSIPIKDTYEGRQKVLAWKVFKDAVDELERTAGQNGFETLVADLVEDLYESCRLYMYEKLNITHESDDSFRAWDKVRTEYLSTMRKFLNLDYENIILISHEDSSKDITKRTGDKITSIKPNIADKIANKLAGMVDIVARVVVDGSVRTLEFKSDEVVFGGGRLKNISKTSVPLSWDALCAVYDEANAGTTPTVNNEAKVAEASEATEAPVTAENVQDVDTPPVVETAESEAPVGRRRKVRSNG